MSIPRAQQQDFLLRNGLATEYLKVAEIWFEPLANSIIQQSNLSAVPLVIGINGCQGSGKTTLAEYLSLMLNTAGLNAMSMSMDDFYLTRSQRIFLGDTVHPLLKTRGVPGTHDVNLLLETLNHLKKNHNDVAVPKFNKALDDRAPQDSWPVYNAPLDVIILEGWCLSVPSQPQEELVKDINELERRQDTQGIWRDYVNQQLLNQYAPIWGQIDQLIMLKAPSLDCVYKWRWEQEEKLHNKIADENNSGLLENNGLLSQEDIRVFIQYFERLTLHGLKAVPELCQHIFYIGHEREMLKYERPA